MDKSMKILILGASGMLGNAVFRLFSECAEYEAFGTIRSDRSKKMFSESLWTNLLSGIDVENIDCLMQVMGDIKPDVVIQNQV